MENYTFGNYPNLNLADMFEKTRRFNAAAGNLMGESTIDNMLMQASLIQEEGGEILDAQSLVEVLDGISDLLVVGFGLWQRVSTTTIPEDTVLNYREVELKSALDNCKIDPLAKALFEPNADIKIEDALASHVYGPNISRVVQQSAVDVIAACVKLIEETGLGKDVGEIITKYYDAVYLSNMSKFDLTHEDARSTQDKYASMGLPTSIHEKVVAIDPNDIYPGYDDIGGLKETRIYVVRVAETTTIGNKVYPKGKVMKSIHYKDPVCFLG